MKQTKTTSRDDTDKCGRVAKNVPYCLYLQMSRARALVWVPDLSLALLPRLKANSTEVFSQARQYLPAQRLLVWGSHPASRSLRPLSRTRVPRWPRHQKIACHPSVAPKQRCGQNTEKPWGGGAACTKQAPAALRRRQGLPAAPKPPSGQPESRERRLSEPGAGCPCRGGVPAERMSLQSGVPGAGRGGTAGLSASPGRGQQHSRSSSHRGAARAAEGPRPVSHRPDSSCTPGERCKYAPGQGRMLSASFQGLSLAWVWGHREGPAGGGRAAPSSRGSRGMRFPAS